MLLDANFAMNFVTVMKIFVKTFTIAIGCNTKPMQKFENPQKKIVNMKIRLCDFKTRENVFKNMINLLYDKLITYVENYYFLYILNI